MFAVFRNDLRIFLRDRSALVFSLLMPILVITVIAGSILHGDEGPRLRVPVVNEDGGPVATTFTKLLADHADVRQVSRAEAEHMVRDTHEAAAAMVFPAQLSKRYLQGHTTEIELLTDPAAGSDVQGVKVLLLLIDKEAAALADPFAEDKITMREQNLTGRSLSINAFEQRVPGFALMFVLLAVVFGTSMSMHDERDWGTLVRLLVAPSGFTRLLLGKLGARFVVGFVQMLLLLAWGHWVYGVSLGSSPSAFLLLTAAAVFAVVAAGMLVAGLARSREQTLPIGLSLVMALSALGGLWWPQSMQPQWMDRISPALFTTWAMRGLNDLILRQRGLDDVLQPIVVLVAYGAATLALGLRLFRVRHSAR
ncbi:MAG TPA: ABC transporter permease [Candidatus Eisenbacteria bacterium]|nr:ABC transporter permease [Candidatus Eisenbacteria bacterium]